MSQDPLRILYRGPLESCNYACEYCPFGKVQLAEDDLAADAEALLRFEEWALGIERPLALLLTPWGEALVHRHTQESLVRLSRAAHVERVAIQTNLSCSLDWAAGADRQALALWVTWHPAWMPMERMLGKLAKLRALGIRHSVGIVGERAHLEPAEAFRRRLPASTYLWINAVKRIEPAYSAPERTRWRAIDPHFETNNRAHPSFGQDCEAGRQSISVDGAGQIRRCHFVSEPIAHIADPEWERALRPRACPQTHCGCHIGYVNLPSLGLRATYGAGILERIPTRTP